MTKNFDLKTALLNRYKLKKSELLTVINELEDRFLFNLISVDMSTCDDDAENRIFAKFIEKQGYTLLCKFHNANYDYDCEKIRMENFDLHQIRDELDCVVTQLREDKTDLEERNKSLKDELKDYKHLSNMRGKIIDRMEQSNTDRENFLSEEISAYKRLVAQLKELLKLARSSVDYHCSLCREYTDGKILIAKIDEVLK